MGRESELALLRGFLEGVSSGRSLVLTGGPGIGKTTLWTGIAFGSFAPDGTQAKVIAYPGDEHELDDPAWQPLS